MSYDLMLMGGSGKKIDKKSFGKYLKNEAIKKIAKAKAWYKIKTTAVNSILNKRKKGGVHSILNYFRPHVFGLEAALELEQFAQAFDATVGDPQGEMGENGVFTRAGFLKGWNHGNAFAYQAMLKQRTEPVSTWPAKRIQQVWEW